MLGVNWIFNKNMVFHLMVNSFHFVYTYSELKRTKKNQSTCLSNCYFCRVKYSKKMKTAEDRRFELKSQLHEQYAGNSNMHFQSFITFGTALFALFGFFGYVYAHTTNVFSQRITPDGSPESIVLVEAQGPEFYTADLLLLLSVVVMGILCFLTCLCVFLGYCERRDQIQLKRIRDNYGLQTVYSNSNHRGYFYYLASYYRIFYTLLLLSQIFVIIVTLCKCPLQGNAHIIFEYFLLSSLVVFSICFKIKYFMNYKRIDAKPDMDNSRYIRLKNAESLRSADLNDIKTKVMGIPPYLPKRHYVIFSDGNETFYLRISRNESKNKSDSQEDVKLPDTKELPWPWSPDTPLGMGMATWFDFLWNHQNCFLRHLIHVVFFVLLCAVFYFLLCCCNKLFLIL